MFCQINHTMSKYSLYVVETICIISNTVKEILRHHRYQTRICFTSIQSVCFPCKWRKLDSARWVTHILLRVKRRNVVNLKKFVRNKEQFHWIHQTTWPQRAPQLGHKVLSLELPRQKHDQKYVAFPLKMNLIEPAGCHYHLCANAFWLLRPNTIFKDIYTCTNNFKSLCPLRTYHWNFSLYQSVSSLSQQPQLFQPSESNDPCCMQKLPGFAPTVKTLKASQYRRGRNHDIPLLYTVVPVEIRASTSSSCSKFFRMAWAKVFMQIHPHVNWTFILSWHAIFVNTVFNIL